PATSPAPFPYTTLFRSLPRRARGIHDLRGGVWRDYQSGVRRRVVRIQGAHIDPETPIRRQGPPQPAILALAHQNARLRIREHSRSEEHTSELQSLRHLV